jgi:hypothetical protein
MVNVVPSATANVTPAALNVDGLVSTKNWNGTTSAIVILTDNQITGDQLTVTASNAQYQTPTIGTGKIVLVNGVVINGADAGNYTLVDTSFQTLGAIGGDPLNGESGTLSRQPTLPQPVVPPITTLPPAPVDVMLPSDFGGGTGTAGYGDGTDSTGGTSSGGANRANGAGGTDGTGGTYGAHGANGSGGSGGAASNGGVGANGDAGANGGGTLSNGTSSNSGRAGGDSASGGSGQGGTNGTSSADGSGSAGSDGGSAAGTGAQTNTAASVDGGGSGSATGSANVNAHDDVTVSQVRTATAEDNGQVIVSVPEAVVSSGETFSFVLPSTITDGAAKAKVRVTLVNGKRLPNWLKYIPATCTFVATAMPGGALPLDVLATLGSKKTVVSIVERKAN